MLKKISLLILALAGILAGANVNAQEAKVAWLRLAHYPTVHAAFPTVAEFSLAGAEVQIKGAEVSIVYASEPTKNRTFDFDLVESFEFELRTVTALDNVKTVVFRAYMDANMLNVESKEALEQVNVYDITGMLVASKKTDETRTQINLSAASRGVYIVQSGTNKMLIVKN